MELIPYLKIGLVIVTVLVTALAGSTRRLGFGLTLIFSIVLTPIGGFLLALLSGPRQRKPNKRKRKRWFARRRPVTAPAVETVAGAEVG